MNDVNPPKPPTLRKYNLTADEWMALAEAQGFVCPICAKEPKKGHFVIDHEHRPKWKKMPPEERKRCIRGLVCRFCNKWNLNFVTTVTRTRRVLAYLEAYEAQKGTS